jgi:hypothetical protein
LQKGYFFLQIFMMMFQDTKGTEEETREYRFDRETDTMIQAAVGMPIRQKTVHPANSPARAEDDFERETDALIKAASPAATFPAAISPARVLQRLPDFPLSHMSFLDLPLPPTTSATALASMSAVLTPDVFRVPPSLTKQNHQALISSQTGNLHFPSPPPGHTLYSAVWENGRFSRSPDKQSPADSSHCSEVLAARLSTVTSGVLELVCVCVCVCVCV